MYVGPKSLVYHPSTSPSWGSNGLVTCIFSRISFGSLVEYMRSWFEDLDWFEDLLRVLENLKHFVWLIMHNSLPTNCFRFHRHITQDVSCHLCDVTE
ncbi:hypothetical protein JHK86_033867 [Glycine max]|nr:hypothetical protein JHK86_033867 [Glycine max]